MDTLTITIYFNGQITNNSFNEQGKILPCHPEGIEHSYDNDVKKFEAQEICVQNFTKLTYIYTFTL